jgi:hypothetical protein
VSAGRVREIKRRADVVLGVREQKLIEAVAISLALRATLTNQHLTLDPFF